MNPEITEHASPPASEKAIIRRGLLTVLVFIGGLLVWGLATRIDSAVIATGKVIIEARPQVLQHDDGGRVKKLHKREGDSVTAGEVIVQFDDTNVLTTRDSLERQLYLNTLSLARVRQELANNEYNAPFVMPAIAFKHHLSATYQQLISHQQRELYGENKRYHQQALQRIQDGLTEVSSTLLMRQQQRIHLQRQVNLAKAELTAVKRLEKQQGVSTSERRAVETQHASLLGSLYALDTQINQTRAKTIELNTQKSTLQSERRVTLLRELEKLESTANELTEKYAVISVTAERTLVRAPMSGVIADMKVHTEGGYVPSGYVIATVIPQNSPFIIQGRVPPHEIDRINLQQPVTVSFPNFNAKITPKFSGHISKIAANSIMDEQLQMEYYPVEVEFDFSSIPPVLRERLISGLPVELYMNTGARAPLYYLFKPFVDFFDHSMREE